MAGIWSAFWDASWPKRLIRYSLSSFDLLDTDAIDLDNLDFSLGRTNVLEFRDVGIRVDKLQALLQLPDALTIQKAKIPLLRLTFFLDLSAPAATIEVNNVYVQIKVATETKVGRKSPSRSHGDAHDDVLPSTIDLAQSFLDTQPLADKKKLEDAIAAESRDLAASFASSEGEDDDDMAYGTGQPLSLPTFMADVIQGVVDRTQVKIQGVTFQLDVEVPAEPSAATPDLVTFELSLDSIDIEGVTTNSTPPQDSADEDGSGGSGDEEPNIVPREGKRHISLNNVRAFLISEANVFSTLSRAPSMPSMPSDLAMQSPVLAERSLSSREPSDLAESAALEPPADLFDEDPLDPLRDSEDAFDIPWDTHELGSDPENEDLVSSPSTPRASTYFASRRREYAPPAQSELLDRPPAWASIDEGTNSESRLPPMGVRGQMTDSAISGAPSQPESEPMSDTSQPDQDDLERSHLFTHEEAESMYMSAFSELNSSSPDSVANTLSQGTPATPTGTTTSQVGTGVSRQAFVEDATPPPWTPSLAHQGRQDPNTDEDPSSSARTVPSPTATMEEESDLVPPEQAPTPRGATRLAKEILSMESISVYIPSNHKHPDISADASQLLYPDLERSTSRYMPGAFSMHAASISADISHPTIPFTPRATHHEDHRSDGVIEIDLAPLELQCDMSIGFLLAKAVAALLEALKFPEKSFPEDEPNASTTGNDSTSGKEKKASAPKIKFHADKILLSFLEKLTGVSDTAERVFGARPASMDAQVLLTTCLVDLNITIARDEYESNTTIDLRTVTFGHPEEDIMSFSQEVQMKASVRDAFPGAGNDVAIRINNSGGMMKCDIKTLPLLMHLDAVKLDETFSWFGGLSSFLNMGASVTSSASPTTKTPPKLPPKSPQKRGVRFRGSEDIDPPAQNTKIDVRVGGMHLDLIGKDCSVVLRSTAIKLVVRDSLMGLGISTIRLDGPYQSNQTPPIHAILSSLDVRYSPQPQAHHLERLLGLITPSKFKFDSEYDEIMVDPLLKQRRKGPVLQVGLEKLTVDVKNLAHLDCLPSLADDVARLAAVAKYLPEDDKPGLLSFVKVNNMDLNVNCSGRLGVFKGAVKNFDVAHISLPLLVALAVGDISVTRNKDEDLLGPSGTKPREPTTVELPVVMARYIGGEIEPVIKVKLRDLRVEYRVPTIMDILNLSMDATPQDFEMAMAQSVANLGDQAHAAMLGKGKAPVRSPSLDAGVVKQTKVDITFRDCLIGLNPLRLSSKMVVSLTDTHLAIMLPKDDAMKVELALNKAGVVLIDDTARLDQKDDGMSKKRRMSEASSPQIGELCRRGYVSILYTSSTRIEVSVNGVQSAERFVKVQVHKNFIVLETCADSTQTLIALANALSPPTPPSKQVKFRTNVPIVKDLMASITGEAFSKAEGDYDFDTDFGINPDFEFEDGADGTDSPLDIQSQYLGGEVTDDDVLFDAGEGSQYSTRTTTRDTGDGVLLSVESPQKPDVSETASDNGSDLVIQDNYFQQPPEVEGTAPAWNSSRNTYDLANTKVDMSPLKVCMRDVHVIWNLHDGFDWQSTRDIITQAVEEMETRTFERRSRPGQSQRRNSNEELYDDDDGTEVGDMLFNSIYIAIPFNRDPQELATAINRQLGDNVTETESLAPTTITTGTSRLGVPRSRPRSRKLKLNRSKRHKITFELKGLCANVITYPPGSGETQNSVAIRVDDFTIYDHIATSTWKKFATYDKDAGEREMGTPMIHAEVLNVKPVPELAASEIVLKINVLPLRLHVDQDALDFITRFFEFKDDSVPVHASESDVPFIQRIEVTAIPVKLDFKPKRVDYSGLRSGRTTEFMNFVVLDQSTLVLRHVIMYGISGFDRMGKTLNDLWTADVKRTQLPTVLAGLAPARSLVNVGSGFKDLVTVPIKEYQKDGRIVRSVRKGATAFIQKTGTEVVKLGAKLAIGTQYALQEVEDLLTDKPDEQEGWDDDDLEGEDSEKKQISLYANQPENLAKGLARAYTSLSRDLSIARDAIIAIPTDVAQSRSATGAAKVVLGKAPILIFRPTIGATKAIGQTLLGATNTIDKDNKRRVEDKYKH